MHSDPISFVSTDYVSYLTGAAILICALGAMHW
jgi:hypothetical protein